MPITSPNPIFDHLLESSQWDDSNKWSNVGFGEEIGIIEINYATNIKNQESMNWSTHISFNDSDEDKIKMVLLM